MFGKNLLFLCALLSPLAGTAELSIISDEEMSEMVGQAFVTLEKNACGSLSCTKINFGLKIETQVNIKRLELGKYDRTGETGVNPATSGSGFADLAIDNMSLGYIDDSGNIVPAVIENPFFELAFRNDGDPANRELIGVRIGFENVDGWLSNTIETLSGEVNINVSSIVGTFRAELVDDIRATQSEVPSLTWLVGAFDLAGYQELPVSNSTGMFISLQKEAVQYTGGPLTTPGFFMNLPTPITIDAGQALSGINRGSNSFRTCHTTPVSTGSSNGEHSLYVGCY